MLHAGLDLSRRRLDYCLLDEAGERVAEGRWRPTLTGCTGSRAVSTGVGVGRGAGGDRVDDRRGSCMTPLERCGRDVEIADAIKVKGLAPLACKTDRIDAWVLAELSRRELVRRSGTCSPGTSPSLRQAPRPLWPHRRPSLSCATGPRLPSDPVIPPRTR
jgi:transposase